MVQCFDGLQGSGKTYRAVHTILNNANSYGKVFTDIGGFQHLKNSDSITYNKFSDIFMSLHQSYLSFQSMGKDNFDNDLVSMLVDRDVLLNPDSPTLFVFDEAHNLFSSRSDAYLVWFLAYHRHFNLDVILITQTYSLLSRDYHKLIQEYVHSLPQSRMLFSNKFKYQHHITVPYYNANTLSKTSTLSLDKNVFAVYRSGDLVRSKSIMTTYLYYILGAIALGGLGTYYMYSTFFGSIEDAPISQVVQSPISRSPTIIPKQKHVDVLKNSNVYLLRFWKNEPNYFYIDGDSYAISLLQIFIENYSPKKLLKIEDDFSVLEHWLFPNEIIVFLAQSKDNYEKPADTSILNPFD